MKMEVGKHQKREIIGNKRVIKVKDSRQKEVETMVETQMEIKEVGKAGLNRK